MPVYRSTRQFIMVRGTPENMAELNSWGVFPDETMGNLENTCWVFDLAQQMITDVIPLAEFTLRFEEIPYEEPKEPVLEEVPDESSTPEESQEEVPVEESQDTPPSDTIE